MTKLGIDRMHILGGRAKNGAYNITNRKNGWKSTWCLQQ